MLDADRSPNAVSVHAGTSQVDFEVDCPPPARSTRRSFDHHGKGNGNFVSKRVSKNEKKVVSLIDLKEMKTRNDCEIACDCVKRANVVLHVDLCKEIFARKHTATHKPTSAQPVHMCHDDTHTPNNRLWSPLAYGLGGNKLTCSCTTTLDKKKRTIIRDCPRLLPCADRA